MLNNLQSADFSVFGAPVQKLVELNTATLTKAFAAQQAAAEKQIAQTQASLQAAMEIKDVEGLTAYLTAQQEAALANVEALKAEAQANVENAQAYFAEVQAILTEGAEVAAKAANLK